MSREAITSWLLDQGEQVTGLRELTQALCAQWLQAGFAVDRVNLGVFALHPEMAGYAVVWEPELDEAIEIAVRREDMDTPMYLNSPIHWLVERGGSFVADLRRPEERARFAVFEEFFERGFEAYFGERIDYGDGGVAVLSVCSRRADRFDTAQVEGLRAVFPALKLFIHLVETRRLAETVLETYLGPDTSKRVLSGQILRGQGESIEAALWLCDLRGFTQLTSSLSSAELIQVMNDYFDAMAEAVWSHGGEILKFMGDAMLVVFRIDDQRSAQDACWQAVAAGTTALDDLKRLSSQRKAQGFAPLSAGIAVHLGKVVYGNIGASRRLDFTVMGHAVNVVARLQTLTAKLDRPLLLSAAVAELVGGDLEPMGAFPIKGVREPLVVYTATPSESG